MRKENYEQIRTKSNYYFRSSRNDGEQSMKNVYVVEKESGLVKIGVSGNVKNRIATLSMQGGFKVKNLYVTEECSNHYNLERIIHANLRDKRRIGEWFEMSFEEAVSTVDKYFSIYGKKENVKKDYADMADKFFDRVSQLQ